MISSLSPMEEELGSRDWTSFELNGVSKITRSSKIDETLIC